MQSIPTSPKAIAITIAVVVGSLLLYKAARSFFPQLPSVAE